MLISESKNIQLTRSGKMQPKILKHSSKFLDKKFLQTCSMKDMRDSLRSLHIAKHIVT